MTVKVRFRELYRICLRGCSSLNRLLRKKGVLARSIFTLRARLQPEAVDDECSTSESEVDYPLTPPLSDDAGSRPLSPQGDVREVPQKLHVTTLQLLHTDSWLETSKRRHGGKTLTRRHLHRA